MKVSKIEKNVQPILNITKNIIKRSDEFNNYYIHEDNNLYQNQLPLLVSRTRIKEIVLHKKLNKIQVAPNKNKLDQEPEEKKIRLFKTSSFKYKKYSNSFKKTSTIVSFL